MRVLLDFTSALGDRTGVGTYTRELARALLAETGALELAVHTRRLGSWRGRLGEMMNGSPGAWRARPSRLLPPRLILEANRLGALPVEAVFGGCDVFHGTNYLAPPGRRCRTVVTVHDLAFVRYEREIPVPHGYRRYIGPALARADRIIAVSRATADDVTDLFGVDSGKVAVVHEGAPEAGPDLPEEAWRRERRRFGIPERFFLFVGTLEPRKNLVRLLAAYRDAARRLRPVPGLVLAGRAGWSDRRILAAMREVGRDLPVVRTGFVPEPVRNALYRHALALLLPSLWEGFGLPVLEAFAHGAPVVCSSAGALPEVAGDAALLTDPEDVAAWSDRLVEVARDESLRRELTGRGRRRATRFTWQRAAKETVRVYEDALHA